MTLSRFLRDYLYISLGGNRKGPARRHVNLMATMLLGGLWHGAGWTFVVWGGLHGLALVLHQAWRGLRQRLRHDLTRSNALGHAASVTLTFLVVVLGWVFFRATSFDAALSLVKGMFGVNGVSLPDVIGLRLGRLGTWLAGQGVVMTPGGGRNFVMTFVWIVALLPVVFLAPNTQQIMQRYQPALDQPEPVVPGHIVWRANPRWAMLMALVLGFGLLSLSRPSEFLYFQF